jgi:hypothetical protein
MRDPGKRFSDGRRIFFDRLEGRQEAVEISVFDDEQRGGGHIVALLIARGD